MSDENFSEDIKIDHENLDAEACVQPELFYKYAKLASQARESMDRAKMNLDSVTVDLSRRVRSTPGAFGVAKITESSVLEAVKDHPDYKAAYENHIQTKSEADILLKAQEAMEQRKRMIELLVQLHSREYFSGPSTPHTPQEFWKEVNKKKGEITQKKMVDKARKRKKVIKKKVTNE